jgi:hypothetical protein
MRHVSGSCRLEGPWRAAARVWAGCPTHGAVPRASCPRLREFESLLSLCSVPGRAPPALAWCTAGIRFAHVAKHPGAESRPYRGARALPCLVRAPA